MKNRLLTGLLIIAACAVAYGVFYAVGREPKAVREALAAQDAMHWLRVEFKLDDAQFAAIRRLHDDYYIECTDHCAAIMEARERQAPAAEVARLEEICESAMTAHFRRVAALMAPAEGRRYLEIVLPRVAGYAHHGAPSVQVHP
jgi:predicted hydrolase (HD superfamily)